MIHPSADVSADARLGERTRVWNRAQVREGAVVGDDCIIGKDAYVDFDVQIGDKVKIQNGALVYHGVTVESGVFIGPGAILTNDRFPRSITPLGELAGADDWTVSEIVLRYGCSVGAGAVVVAGSDVGRFATVGAGAIVTRSVPDFGLVVGNPARLLGWVCACGRRLTDQRGHPLPGDAEGAASCPACGREYDLQGGRCVPLEGARRQDPRGTPGQDATVSGGASGATASASPGTPSGGARPAGPTTSSGGAA